MLDYIPRGEHVRLLEARLAAKEGDLQLEMSSRVAQASGGACRRWDTFQLLLPEDGQPQPQPAWHSARRKLRCRRQAAWLPA